MKDAITKLCTILNNLKVRYALVGGIAAILYGVQRITLDIDVIIQVSGEDELRALTKGLGEGGFTISLEDVLQALRERTHFTCLYNSVVIDFKIAREELDVLTIRNRRAITVDHVKIFITPLEELITAKLKILGSLKDVEDALQLMYMYHDILDWRKLHTLLREEVFKYVDRLLCIVSKEFADDQYVINKVKSLEALKAKIQKLVK